ncbi:MAG: ribonuclease VapC [Candidatus Binatia bacterium]|nr:MAG: ribonuclease VapC [Candidatus Binatia bacterium]
MVVPDVNLLVYAHNAGAPWHARARSWWEDLVNEDVPVGMPWAVTFGFLRVVTHPAVLTSPLRPLQALEIVSGWFEFPNVQPLEPGPRHLAIVRRLFEATQVAGRLVTDTHLAALAIEHGCELHSNDNDFERFPGLRWRNPLGKK